MEGESPSAIYWGGGCLRTFKKKFVSIRDSLCLDSECPWGTGKDKRGRLDFSSVS